MAKTRRAQRKGTRKLSKWNLYVKKVQAEMKRKDRSATFSAALKEASRRKDRKGEY